MDTTPTPAPATAFHLTAQGVLDFWRCPRLYELRHMMGLHRVLADLDDQAAETVALKTKSLMQLVPPARVANLPDSFRFTRRVESGTSMATAKQEMSTDMELHLAAALWAPAADTIEEFGVADFGAVMVELTKQPTIKRRKGETGEEFHRRCIEAIQADLDAHYSILYLTLSPSVYAEARALRALTRVAMSECVNYYGFPGVRRGARCGICEMRRLCLNGEAELYRFADGSLLETLD